MKINNTNRIITPQGRALNFSMGESTNNNNNNNGPPTLFVTAPPPSLPILPMQKPKKVFQKSSFIDDDLSDVSMDDEEQYTKKPDPLMDAFREIQKRKMMTSAAKKIVPECVNNGTMYKVSLYCECCIEN